MNLVLKKRWKFFVCSLIFSLSCRAQSPALNIVPQPASLQQNEGLFVIDQKVSVNFAANNKELQRLATYFPGRSAAYLLTGYRLIRNGQKRCGSNEKAAAPGTETKPAG